MKLKCPESCQKWSEKELRGKKGYDECRQAISMKNHVYVHCTVQVH